MPMTCLGSCGERRRPEGGAAKGALGQDINPENRCPISLRDSPSASRCHKVGGKAKITTVPSMLRTVNIIVGTKIGVMCFRQ